jgi:hypothetical protein
MQLLDILLNAQGGQLAGNLARAYRISPAEAEAAIRAVLPALAENLERNTLNRGGLADLVQALGHGHHEQALDHPAVFADPNWRADGDRILGNILGTKDKSRAVAAQASRQTGLSEELIKSMLPSVATILMGGLARQTRQSFGDVISKLPPGLSGGAASARMQWPGQNQNQDQDQGGGGFQMPWPQQQQQPQQRGNPMPWPDQSGGRNPMPWPQQNETGGTMGGGGMGGGMSGNLPNQSPLPLPGNVPNLPSGGNNPYGDLGDILRKGGIQIPFPMPGGGSGGGGAGGDVLSNIIRSILGSLLGFGGGAGGGVMSWFIRMIVMKYGWAILRRMIGMR